MKQWLETREVLDRIAEVLKEGRRAALATVVRVRGSAYRHEGAKLLVVEDGTTTGNVSGGCLEADVREVALGVLARGRSEVRTYCAGADEVAAWDLGVGCEGQVEVLVEVVADDRARERALMREPSAFASCALVDAPEARLVVTANGAWGSLGDPRLDTAANALARAALADGDDSATHDVAGRAVFVDVLRPPPRLVVVSAGDDARPLAAFGAAIGFDVVVIDRRPALLTVERFPRARLIAARADELSASLELGADDFAVVMNHSYADDRAWLRALLDSAVAYIGVLGPRQRTDRMLAELAADGPVDADRIYGPIGLDIGTDGAEQVAISALSEILAVRSGRRPTSLRERRRPIHLDAGD